MLKYKMKISGPKLDEVAEKSIQKIRDAMIEIGNSTKDQLQFHIRTSVRRKSMSGALANSIGLTYLETPTSIFVGVGDMVEMFAKAPYWFVVNYGAHFPGSYEDAQKGLTGAPYIPLNNTPGNPQNSFVPGGSFNGSAPDGSQGGMGSQPWNKPGNFSFAPSHAIRAINYIEKTSAWLVPFWNNYWATKLK